MNRYEWIDISKGIAIVLIVFGHTLRLGIARDIVYSFHVPLFFFLSGVVCKDELLKKQMHTDFKRIMIPYFAFGVISIGIYSLLGKIAASSFGMKISTSVVHNICRLLYGASILQFNAPLWYLPCLFMTRIWYQLQSRVWKGNRIALICVALVGSGFGFLYTNMKRWDLPFSFELTLKLFPFFLSGKLLAPALIRMGNTTNKTLEYALFGCALLIITSVLSVLAPSINYTNNMFPEPIQFYCIAGLGCAGICCLAFSIQSTRWLSWLGRNSLPILVMHKFPVVFFQIVGPFKTYLQNPDSFSGMLLGCAPVAAFSILLSVVVGGIIKKKAPRLLGMLH